MLKGALTMMEKLGPLRARFYAEFSKTYRFEYLSKKASVSATARRCTASGV
jgi:hypothetical protein